MFTVQSVEHHRTIDMLQRVARRNQALIESSGLDLRLGEYENCPFLKLDKPSWHNRGEVEVPGQIFFSVWTDATGRLCYNIHALKLRHLKAYRLQSREFAAEFRARFEAAGWPNVSVSFGPQTLMQGWVSSEAELDEVIARFCSMCVLIDELLMGSK